ncbi:MAG: Spo0B domain-containing protein [Eubacteriales bacterium]
MELKKILEVVRIQRHDFLNHLQVISGLLQLNKADRAREYIGQVSREIGKAGKMSRIKTPEVEAAILGVFYDAANYEIEVKLSANTGMEECGLPGPVAGETLEKIFALALRSLASSGRGQKSLEVVFDEHEKNYSCRVLFQKPAGIDLMLLEEELSRAEQISLPHGGRAKLALSEDVFEIFFLIPRKRREDGYNS